MGKKPLITLEAGNQIIPVRAKLVKHAFLLHLFISHSEP